MPNDWTSQLNLSRALRNVRTDITNDWYRDPWGWPEYDFLLPGHVDWFVRRARSTGVRYVTNIDVPKENFGIRPAIVMEPLDRLLYQSLVDATSADLIGDLANWVYGWRLKRTGTRPGFYLHQAGEWESYRGYLKTASHIFDYGLKTDIVSCFASIPIQRLCDDVQSRAGTTDTTNRLTDMLSAFDRVPGRKGLPQRSMASAALANMYLGRMRSAIDDYADAVPAYLRKLVGGNPATRWMDDFWAFGDDEALLRSLQIDLQSAARNAGLELNLGKTDVYKDNELWSVVAKIEHSAIDGAIRLSPPDVEPLEQLIDHLIESPEKSDRTSIRFAMTRMREQRMKTRLAQITAVAPRMPHGADHLARVFRDFRIWRASEDWFLEYASSAWGQISWSVAQIGTMFPTKTRPSAIVRNKFAEFLVAGSAFPLFALSAQRLSSWAPRQARDRLHDLLEEADHPQERRIIGLAAAAAGEKAGFIRSVLSEFEENQLTLAVLEERAFTPFNPAPDFGPDSAN